MQTKIDRCTHCEVVVAEEVAAEECDELVSVIVELDDDVDWPPKPGRLIVGSGGKLRLGKPSILPSVAVASPPPLQRTCQRANSRTLGEDECSQDPVRD